MGTYQCDTIFCTKVMFSRISFSFPLLVAPSVLLNLVFSWVNIKNLFRGSLFAINKFPLHLQYHGHFLGHLASFFCSSHLASCRYHIIFFFTKYMLMSLWVPKCSYLKKQQYYVKIFTSRYLLMILP